jgi:hypothetical protein
MRAYVRKLFSGSCSVMGEWHSQTKNVRGRRRSRPSPRPSPHWERETKSSVVIKPVGSTNVVCAKLSARLNRISRSNGCL